jgi:hypothetical protein
MNAPTIKVNEVNEEDSIGSEEIESSSDEEDELSLSYGS